METRAVRRDEEGKKKAERVVVAAVPRTRKPETMRYVEKKLVDKGLQRMDRHPVDGLGGLGAPPPKSGHGGKFTWEGPEDPAEAELDPAPPALDPRDPNYDDDQEQLEKGRGRRGGGGGGGGAAEDDDDDDEAAEEKIVGEVEVAKVAEAREGVSRIEILPPLQLQP
ncbi:uncharacterized protein LOC109723109 [Ananas comosus]|uniref:Uncharacterized protein LOC109723109 n=1 Tax=Ananas comosus TaxID=4615 RepID=A0A6P5GGE6_ANACO|nr:uncharacterized protein LOC109723109 [Ananas comosus]